MRVSSRAASATRRVRDLSRREDLHAGPPPLSSPAPPAPARPMRSSTSTSAARLAYLAAWMSIGQAVRRLDADRIDPSPPVDQSCSKTYRPTTVSVLDNVLHRHPHPPPKPPHPHNKKNTKTTKKKLRRRDVATWTKNDFRMILPRLEGLRRRFLATLLAQIDPEHPWLSTLERGGRR